MADPEKQNLILLSDDQNQPKEIRINPRCFSVKALREIVRFQVFRNDATTEIAIINGKTAFVPTSTIHKARGLFGNDRKRFLDVIALAMHDGKKVIISVVQK